MAAAESGIPNDAADRRWWAATAALVTAWTALLGVGLAAGRIGNLGGDASVRLVSANFCATDLGRCAAPLLDGPWPPGQTVVLAPAILIGGVFGISPPMVGSVVALVFFAASAWLVGRLAAGLAGEMAGLLAVAILVTLQVVMNWSTNTYGEIFALAPMLGALCVFVRWPRSPMVNATAVGVLLLFATMVRTEAIVVAGVLSVLLWFRGERFEAIVVSLVAASYTAGAALFGRGGRGLAYTEIGEWYGFTSGRTAMAEIGDTLRSVMSRPNPVFGVLVVLAAIWLVARHRDRATIVPVLVTVTAFNAGLALFGFVKSTDRYYIWTAALGAVLVAQLAATALGALERRDVAAALASAACLLLSLVAWSTHRDVEARYRTFADPQTDEMNGWLGANVEPDSTVFFDFIRFYGVYFRSHLDPGGAARDHFDYTSYYSGLPQRQPVRVPVSEVGRNPQIREFGHERLREDCPSYIVVARGSLLRRVTIEQPELLMVAPFILQEPDGTEVYEDPNASYEIQLELVHDNGKFAAYRTDCTEP